METDFKFEVGQNVRHRLTGEPMLIIERKLQECYNAKQNWYSVRQLLGYVGGMQNQCRTNLDTTFNVVEMEIGTLDEVKQAIRVREKEEGLK